MIKSIFAGGVFRVTSAFGKRVLNGAVNVHNGIDIVGVSSKTIVAVEGGTIMRSRIVTDRNDKTWQWGNYVCVRGNDGRYYYYCHMESRTVEVGQAVSVGSVLGIMGNTGYSFGAHTHFEVRGSDGASVLNPADILGIPNAEGMYTATGDSDSEKDVRGYAELIAAKVGYDDQKQAVYALTTLRHNDPLPFLRKLWEALNK